MPTHPLDPQVHIAGPLTDDGLQLCIRCGIILTDYRGAEVPSRDAARPLRGWKAGAHIKVSHYGAARFSDLVDEPASCKQK